MANSHWISIETVFKEAQILGKSLNQLLFKELKNMMDKNLKGK
jgi:hypothetical protein